MSGMMDDTADGMLEDGVAEDVDRGPDYQKRIDEITQCLKKGRIGYEPVLQFFGYDHLKKEQRDISEMFARMALHLFDTLPANIMREIALGKLLEAKDAAVRSTLQVTTNRFR